MTMGLKIHRMLKEERRDPPEMLEEAQKRKEVSDNILELIYNKLTGHRSKKTEVICKDEEDEGEGA